MTKLLYVPIGNVEDAKELSRQLLEEKLIFCANIIPNIQSLYLWNDKIEESDEVALILKTESEDLEGVISKIKQLHKYQEPIVVEL